MEIKIKTPIKAIREKCLECCAGQINEVRCCPCITCSCWFYRFGKRPETLIKQKSIWIEPLCFANNTGKSSDILIAELENKTIDSYSFIQNNKVSK